MNDIQLTPHLTSSNALTLSHSNKLDDIRLTEHFKLSEFTRSATASRMNIDNSLNPDNPQHAKIISNLKNLCVQVLEPLRAHANSNPSPLTGSLACGEHVEPGGVSIIIGSGYRCPPLNKAVGGVPNSQHQTGEAADIHLYTNAEGREWFTWLMDNTAFDQLLFERESPTSNHYWIHVSCRLDLTQNRQQVKHITKASSKRTG